MSSLLGCPGERPPPGGGPLPVTAFTAEYAPDEGGQCGGPLREVAGYAPNTPGERYPLLIFTTGTWATFNDRNTLAMMREVAEAGFVAVTAGYDNNFLLGCANLRAKTHCLYDGTEPNSAVSVLCARPDVDCDLGIFVAGLSQGSQVASYARNWNHHIRAVYGLGVTSDYFFNLGAGDNPGLSNPGGAADDQCLHDSRTAISSERVRYVNGLNEVCYSTSAQPCGLFGSQGELQRMSGNACATEAMSCLRENGSGWFIIPNSDVQDGDADHVYVTYGEGLDVGFVAPANHPWSLGTNVRWLLGFAAPGGGLPVRIDAGALTASDGAFSKDSDFAGTGLSIESTSTTIDTVAPNAASPRVYQTARTTSGDALSYVIGGLLPNAAYLARLHFAELTQDTIGARQFHIDIQGARRETNLDVRAVSGARFRALVRDHAFVADAEGRLTLSLTRGGAGNPMVSGIEVM
ncbi:MAG: malectin domain-containing carbohydrate-binding protein [Myxococcaceae bacterium]